MAKSPDELNPSDVDQGLTDPEFAEPSELGHAPSDPELAAQPDASSNSPSAAQQLRAEISSLQDRLLRSQAELENFRRRTQREVQEERRFANQRLLVDLLPVLDNMERAIVAAEQNPDTTGLLEGFKMVHQLLLNTLESHNCRRVPAAGVNFDPTLHEAISQVPSASDPAGTVTQVLQHGYQLHDRVIRPAQVVVSSGPTGDSSAG